MLGEVAGDRDPCPNEARGAEATMSSNQTLLGTSTGRLVSTLTSSAVELARGR